jgi:dihydrofolate reductase
MAADVVLHMAVSLDGRIADAAGGVGWLDAYPATDFAFDAFIADVGAILMGRTSYEAGKRLGPWPYEAMPCIVLTHAPPLTELAFLAFRTLTVRAAVAELRAKTDKAIWIMGGGDVARQALEEDQVDRIELVFVPEILGAGPLWLPAGGPRPNFSPVRTAARPNGAFQVSLVRA